MKSKFKFEEKDLCERRSGEIGGAEIDYEDGIGKATQQLTHNFSRLAENLVDHPAERFMDSIHFALDQLDAPPN